LKSAKTKILNEILSKKFAIEKALIVDDENRALELSGRNLKNIKVLRSEGVNVYDIVRYDWVLFSKKAVKGVESRLAVAE
jgi:large subunit ribosomal protein L4